MAVATRSARGLGCPDVLVARDSLPTMPFSGAIVYVDHEAGIGAGRDAGRMAEAGLKALEPWEYMEIP